VCVCVCKWTDGENVISARRPPSCAGSAGRRSNVERAEGGNVWAVSLRGRRGDGSKNTSAPRREELRLLSCEQTAPVLVSRPRPRITFCFSLWRNIPLSGGKKLNVFSLSLSLSLYSDCKRRTMFPFELLLNSKWFPSGGRQ